MQIEKLTWRDGIGWTDALPRPDHRDALVLVFGSSELPEAAAEAMRELSEIWAGHAVIGCSTSGQILDGVIPDDDLVVVVARFDHTRVAVQHVGLDRAGGPRRCGRRIAEALASPGLRGIFVVCDGLMVNGTSLASGIADVLPRTPVSGGLAGDDHRFSSTWTLIDGRPQRGWVSAVGFSGDAVELGYGSAGGWNIFGPERLVTRSYGSELYELDGKPALQLYRDYLGDRAAGLPATALLFPLSIRDLDGRTVVRTILEVNEDRQSISFAGDIAQGSVAQLMHASVDSLVHGAHLAAKQAGQGDEQLAIAVSCVGRRMVLGHRAEEELDAALEALAPSAVMTGFYSYGELSTTDGTCDLHNQTMTITTIAERTPAAS